MDELIGRREQLEVLLASLAACSQGRGSLGVVVGEAGIGKTRLVREVREHARGAGYLTIEAAADEWRRMVPFAPLTEAFGCRAGSADPLRARVATLLRADAASPILGPDRGGTTAQIIEAFCELVESLAVASPMVVILEDAHWCDRATLAAVRTFARRFADLPLVLLVSTRPTHVADWERSDATVIEVGPLSDEEAKALAADLIGSPPGERLAGLITRADGNALFITELVRSLTDDGAISIAGGVADIDEVQLPPPLRQTILRRLSSQSAASIDLLRLASLLGTTFDAAELAAAAGVGGLELDRSLREIMERGVLVPAGEHVAFRHDLVREAIYTDIAPSVRQAMHRELAEVLEAAGAPRARVVEHLARGAMRGDEHAIERLDEAWLNAIRTLDAEEAMRLMRIADELHDPDDPRRDLYVLLRTIERIEAGDPDGAVRMVGAKLTPGRPPAIEAVLRFNLSVLLQGLGRLEEAKQQEERLVAVEGLDPVMRLAAVEQAWRQAADRGDWDAIEHYASIAAPIAEREGDQLSVALMRFWRAVGRFNKGHLREAVALLRDVGTVDGRLNDVIRAELVYLLSECDLTEEARAIVAADGGRSPDTSLFIAADLVQRGGWDDAAAEFEAMHAEDPDHPWAPGGLAALALFRGRPDDAQMWLDRMEPLVGNGSAADLFVLTTAELLESLGQLHEALALLRERWAALTRFRAPGVFRRLAPTAVRIALGGDDRDFAGAVVADAVSWADAAGAVPSADAMAMICRGLYRVDPEELLHAIELYRTVDRPFELALCREHAANVLAANERMDDARVQWDEAYAAFEAMGAELFAARVAAAMRNAGMRRGVRGKRGRPAAGWESLTPTELKVVEHVTTGLRNAEVAERLFISPRTVGTHLQHVYGKLGLSSRVELTRAFAERTRGADHPG